MTNIFHKAEKISPNFLRNGVVEHWYYSRSLCQHWKASYLGIGSADNFGTSQREIGHTELVSTIFLSASPTVWKKFMSCFEPILPKSSRMWFLSALPPTDNHQTFIPHNQYWELFLNCPIELKKCFYCSWKVHQFSLYRRLRPKKLWDIGKRGYWLYLAKKNPRTDWRGWFKGQNNLTTL